MAGLLAGCPAVLAANRGAPSLPPATLNMPTAPYRALACSRIASAAAAASSTSAAFCWVTSSIWMTAWLTCWKLRPELSLFRVHGPHEQEFGRMADRDPLSLNH